MATHSSILAWRIPWTAEPGGLQSMQSQRVRHDSKHACTQKPGVLADICNTQCSPLQKLLPGPKCMSLLLLLRNAWVKLYETAISLGQKVKIWAIPWDSI